MNKAHPKDSHSADVLADALDCCQHIATLAQTLQRAGINPDSGITDPLLVSNAGYLISREVAQLRAVIEQVRTQPAGAPEDLP
jgi:hypothetical protein